jgi:spore germination protein YaaH
MTNRKSFIALLATALFVAITATATPAYAAFQLPLPVFSPFWWLQSALGLNSQPTNQASVQATRPSPKATAKATTKPTPSPSPTPEQQEAPAATVIEEVKEAFTNQIAQAQEPKKVVAGWLTPWGDDSFVSFKNNLDTITEVHPFVYTVSANGMSLDASDPASWHKDEVLRLAKEHNIKVIPTSSGDVNHSDLMLNDPAKRAAHIQAILKEIEINGYDGWNVDYEGFLNGYNRDVYATFLTDLSKELHARNKILAFSVEAFNRKQNWEVIGKVVDRFMLMGYDYNSARGPQVGPIGPASWLQEVIDYTATRVPKEKIVLGLGTYGYSWIHNGAQYVSTAVSYQDALDIAKETGATIKREQDAPYFTYDRGAGQRHLYFEDAVSTAPKLELAAKSDIAGVAFWRLGTEDVKIWDGMTDILNK